MPAELVPRSYRKSHLKSPDVFTFAQITNLINSTMRFFTIVALLTFFVIGCGHKKTSSLPSAPTNVDSVIKTIKGKKYKTADLALISTLISDKNNPYQWFDEIGDTTAFFKNEKEGKMRFGLNFINDITVEITDKARMSKAKWIIDDQPKSQETAGIFLRLFIENSTVKPSYKVLGLDDKQIFLETPNMFMSRKMAVLMKAE